MFLLLLLLNYMMSDITNSHGLKTFFNIFYNCTIYTKNVGMSRTKRCWPSASSGFCNRFCRRNGRRKRRLMCGRRTCSSACRRRSRSFRCRRDSRRSWSSRPWRRRGNRRERNQAGCPIDCGGGRKSKGARHRRKSLIRPAFVCCRRPNVSLYELFASYSYKKLLVGM